MEKTTLPPPPIANAADYVDALSRLSTQDLLVKKKVIPGRRMRDKFREAMVVVEVVKEPG
jgi:hypothetical protein